MFWGRVNLASFVVRFRLLKHSTFAGMDEERPSDAVGARGNPSAVVFDQQWRVLSERWLACGCFVCRGGTSRELGWFSFIRLLWSFPCVVQHQFLEVIHF